jgi:hypothetical protein
MTVAETQHTSTTTKRKNGRRAVKVLALVGGLTLVGGVAFAYWTQGGTGTGTASTGTTTANLAVHQTSSISGLAPGGSAQTISGNFDNPNSSPVYVASVTVSIASVTKATGATGDCDATDYALSNATMTVDDEIDPGTGVGTWGGATIAFNDKDDTNQNGCKGATVNLSFAVNPS